MNEVTESPCIQICELDPNDICIGCGRSLQEIGNWLDASEADRAAICERAALRLQAPRSARRS